MGAAASAEERACELDAASWCKELQCRTLNELWAIPATHNSCCVKPRSSSSFGWTWAQTQSADLQSQLEMGVRALDLRLCDDAGDGEVWVSHSFVSSMNLKAVLVCLKEFLDGHPSEFLILQLRRDHGRKISDEVSGKIAALFKECNFRLPPFEPLGLDTPLHKLAGGLLVSTPHFPGICPELWPGDLFEGAGLVPMWHWGTLQEAKERIEEHVLSGQHLITSKGHLTGVALDGSFHWMPPGWWATDLKNWLREQALGSWSQQLPRVGIIMADFVTPEFCKEILRRNLRAARCSGDGDAQPGPSCACSSSATELGGICHVGVSRCVRTKRLQVACREELPEGCELTAEAFANHHSDVYDCRLVRLGPKRMELTVCRTDCTDGGWGQDLFVRWKARLP